MLAQILNLIKRLKSYLIVSHFIYIQQAHQIYLELTMIFFVDPPGNLSANCDAA